MKAVPILIITNALALGLVVLLFVQQQDMKSQLGSKRSTGDRGGAAIEAAALEARIDALAAQMAERDRGGPLSVEAADAAAIEFPEGAAATPGSDDIAGDGGAPPPEMQFDAKEMEVFRNKVRKALELNRDEDWVRRVEERLDNLIDNSRIGGLNNKQKQQLAGQLLDYRRQIPGIFRRLRESGTLEGVSREERREVYRAEFDSLRAEAQKNMETIVPAADAKTILEDAGSLLRGGGDFGQGGPRRGGRGGGSR